MSRRREKIQWRERMRTWVGRITTVRDDGTLDRGDGWVDLRTDNQELAQKAYENWLETGEPPRQADKRTFEQAARDFIAASPQNRQTRDRLARLVKYAFPEIGMVQVGELRPGHVKSVLKAMGSKHGRSAGAMLKMRSDISQVLSELMGEDVIEANVALGVELPKDAPVDTRLRMNLTDEQYLALLPTLTAPLSLMVRLCREVAGYRTSDLHAGDWLYVDTESFAWVKVRRPKTDGEVGKNVAQRKVRHYERVEHGVPEHVRPYIETHWRSLGCPKRGPMFPTLRAGVGGTATSRHGGQYEREASEVGSFKADGTSYADDLRKAVWNAKLYSPRTDEGFDDFDPAHPDPLKCALQTDTPTTKRLDFASLRRDYVTAVADSGVSTQEALALSGHTQLTTQMRHYMKGRRVATPDAALPGRKKTPVAPVTPPPSDDRLAALERMMAEMLALQTGQTRGATPDNGVEEPRRHLKLVGKPSK